MKGTKPRGVKKNWEKRVAEPNRSGVPVVQAYVTWTEKSQWGGGSSDQGGKGRSLNGQGLFRQGKIGERGGENLKEKSVSRSP